MSLADIITKSQVEAGHTLTVEIAKENIAEAYLRIFEQIRRHKLNFMMVSLESLFRPGAIEQLVISLGLDYSSVIETVQDSNAKYYGGEIFSDQRTVEQRMIFDLLSRIEYNVNTAPTNTS